MATAKAQATWKGTLKEGAGTMAGIRAIESGLSVLRPVRAAASAGFDAYGRPRDLTLANWDRPPYNRWSFQHMREIVPTASIEAGRAMELLEEAHWHGAGGGR